MALRPAGLTGSRASWPQRSHRPQLRLVPGEVEDEAAVAEAIPAGEWRGAAFLADRWESDDRRVRSELGFKPAADPQGVSDGLRRAIGKMWEAIRSRV